MRKTRFIVVFLIMISIILATSPAVISQVGTYTFSGAAGNQKTLRVRTVNEDALEDLFGPTWSTVLETSFGPGSTDVGAGLKSVVVAVNMSDTKDLTLYALGTADMATYKTNTWNWTLGAFSADPHQENVTVSSFYDPELLTDYIQTFWYYYFLIGFNLTVYLNVSVQNAAIYLTQLPTPVAEYLGEIEWEANWGSVGNTIVHHATALEWAFLYTHQYLQNCTEVWTYDETYGAYIGYKILVNTSTVIYEYNIDLSSLTEIPGYELPIIIGISGVGIISLIFIVMKKKH